MLKKCQVSTFRIVIPEVSSFIHIPVPHLVVSFHYGYFYIKDSSNFFFFGYTVSFFSCAFKLKAHADFHSSTFLFPLFFCRLCWFIFWHTLQWTLWLSSTLFCAAVLENRVCFSTTIARFTFCSYTYPLYLSFFVSFVFCWRLLFSI